MASEEHHAETLTLQVWDASTHVCLVPSCIGAPTPRAAS